MTKKRRAHYYPAKTHCHICGLRIIEHIISPHHPLYGTIDHLLPISMGGKDRAANRLPAHRLCNIRRGAAFVTEAMRVECRSLAKAEIARWVSIYAGETGKRTWTKVDPAVIENSKGRLEEAWGRATVKVVGAGEVMMENDDGCRMEARSFE